MRKFCLLTILFFLIFHYGHILAKSVECVNTPTAEITDYATGLITVRLYSYGGMISRFIFAPVNRINIGGSLDVDKLIGCETPEIRDPSFYFKWKIFDGTKYFPSVAIGYDGQAYKFVSSEYTLPAKGLYLVFSKNVFDKTFTDFGINLTRYKDKSKIFCFISIQGIIEDMFVIGIECENINQQEVQQINCKLGLVLAKVVSVDFVFVNVSNDWTKIERQMRINYMYKF